jgi:site-specific DNA recombinase
LDAIAAQGRPSGSVVFGYRHVKDKSGEKTLEAVPSQAEAIRRAAERVLIGWSLANIAAELTARGLRGAHGGVIAAGQVRKMLTNATVAGHRVHRGRIVGRGVWEPILDEDTWQACKAKLTANRTVRRVGGGSYPVGAAHRGNPVCRRYLLTGGLAVCGVCSAPLVASMKQLKNMGTTRPYYLCHPNRGGRACVGINAEDTERYVVAMLFDELDKPEVSGCDRR